jgi:hypothetical protein
MSVKGMSYPQQKPMSSGSPAASALKDNNEAAQKHSDLIKATSGGSKRRRRRIKKKSRRYKYGGASGTIVVPQLQVGYKPTGANGQDPNSIIANSNKSSTQGSENAKYDSAAFQKGGYIYNKKSKKGGKRSYKSMKTKKSKKHKRK